MKFKWPFPRFLYPWIKMAKSLKKKKKKKKVIHRNFADRSNECLILRVVRVAKEISRYRYHRGIMKQRLVRN